MPGSTTHYEIPYPLGTDPADTIDDTVRAMAELLDLMQGEYGEVTFNPPAADTDQFVDVTYARDYTAMPYGPRAFLMLGSVMATGTVLRLWVTNETRTGFRLNYRSSNTSAKTVRWYARSVADL